MFVAYETDALHLVPLCHREHLRDRVIVRPSIRSDVQFGLRILRRLDPEIVFQRVELNLRSVPDDRAIPVDVDPDRFDNFVSGGGGVWLGRGMSSFTACVMTGRVMMNIISSTNMTSINGVVLTSIIGSSSPPAPTFIAIRYLNLCCGAASAIGLLSRRVQ